jgi:hypothetical protein
MNLTNEQKALIYDEGIRRYNLIEEQIRQIKSKSFEVSDQDQKIIDQLKLKMNFIFSQTQKLHNK